MIYFHYLWSIVISNETQNETEEYIFEMLSKYFIPKENITMDISNLLSRKQQPNKAFDHFFYVLKKRIKPCRFGDLEEKISRSRIVFGVTPQDLIKSL